MSNPPQNTPPKRHSDPVGYLLDKAVEQSRAQSVILQGHAPKLIVFEQASADAEIVRRDRIISSNDFASQLIKAAFEEAEGEKIIVSAAIISCGSADVPQLKTINRKNYHGHYCMIATRLDRGQSKPSVTAMKATFATDFSKITGWSKPEYECRGFDKTPDAAGVKLFWDSYDKAIKRGIQKERHYTSVAEMMACPVIPGSETRLYGQAIISGTQFIEEVKALSTAYCQSAIGNSKPAKMIFGTGYKVSDEPQNIAAFPLPSSCDPNVPFRVQAMIAGHLEKACEADVMTTIALCTPGTYRINGGDRKTSLNTIAHTPDQRVVLYVVPVKYSRNGKVLKLGKPRVKTWEKGLKCSQLIFNIWALFFKHADGTLDAPDGCWAEFDKSTYIDFSSTEDEAGAGE